MNIIAERLKKRRKALGLSKAETARRMGVSSTSYYSWENKNCVPSIEALLKAAKVLKVSTNWLMGEVDSEAKKTEAKKRTKGIKKPKQRQNEYKYLQTTGGKYVCTAKECEWRIHGFCPGVGCMKEKEEER